MSEGNRERVLAAPVTLVLAADTGFHTHIPTLAPHMTALADSLAGQPEQRESMARMNALIQAGYLIVGLRAAGLAAGPMGGMDADAIDQEFFRQRLEDAARRQRRPRRGRRHAPPPRRASRLRAGVAERLSVARRTAQGHWLSECDDTL